MATTTPAGGFVVTRLARGYGVARDGAVVSIHATRDEAEAMIAALERHARPPSDHRGAAPLRPS